MYITYCSETASLAYPSRSVSQNAASAAEDRRKQVKMCNMTLCCSVLQCVVACCSALHRVAPQPKITKITATEDHLEQVQICAMTLC